MKNINTDNILKKLREFRPRSYGDKPTTISLNPIDVRYLKANLGFGIVLDKEEIFGLRIFEDDNVKIGECKIHGLPRLKKWL